MVLQENGFWKNVRKTDTIEPVVGKQKTKTNKRKGNGDKYQLHENLKLNKKATTIIMPYLIQ